MKNNILGVIAALTLVTFPIYTKAQNNTRAKNEFLQLLRNNAQNWEMSKGDTIVRYTNQQFSISKDNLIITCQIDKTIAATPEFSCQRKLSFPLASISSIVINQGHPYYHTTSYLATLRLSSIDGTVLERCPKTDIFPEDKYPMTEFPFGIKANHSANVGSRLNGLLLKIK